ncbi:hypothetical protein [Halomonas ramblicola]|uniref:hypothetical protein n=1 Tax=Halomonas ramblicola TaxID=747349 RepID=UPI0025B546EE|nr:hypothetical protein [Halomonas ramblicola]MDN3522080.1 hypothetical protein [Halomonas ramblicola]
MKKLVIHIGAKKTGSTTLQAALKENARLLSVEGVFVSKICGATEDLWATRPYMACHVEKSRERIIQWFDGARKFQSKGAPLAILTAESFSDLTLDEILSFKDDIPDIFDDIKVVFYVRRQDLSAVSHYSTALKGGGDSKSLMSKKMGKRGRRPFSYGTIASDWASAFGKENVLVRRYVEGRVGGWDIVKDFLDLFDIPFDSHDLKYSSRNKSLGRVEAACLRRYNEMVKKGDIVYSQKVKSEILKKARSYGDNAEKVPFPKKAHAYRFFRSFDDENRRLKDMFFPDSEFLFDEDFGMYPEVQCDIDTYVKEDVFGSQE